MRMTDRAPQVILLADCGIGQGGGFVLTGSLLCHGAQGRCLVGAEAVENLQGMGRVALCQCNVRGKNRLCRC